MNEREKMAKSERYELCAGMRKAIDEHKNKKEINTEEKNKIISLIFKGELSVAKTALRKYIKTNKLASNAYYRLDEILKGRTQDIDKSVKKIILMLQQHE